MRTLIISLVCIFGGLLASAQEVEFTVEASRDSVLFGNSFKVVFTIKNGAVENFSSPDFEGCTIVGGPNHSSQISIINGVKSQSTSYSYFLKPIEEGLLFIQSASVKIDSLILETAPIEIKVLPNPDGIIESPELKKEQDFFHNPFWSPKKRAEKPKKKYKTYKT